MSGEPDFVQLWLFFWLVLVVESNMKLVLLLVDRATSFRNFICNYCGCMVEMSMGGVIVMLG